MVAELVDVGIDYATITAKTPYTCLRLVDAAHNAAYYERSVNREYEHDKVIQGYRGIEIGRIFYGERDDGVMVRASSGMAHILMGYVGEWGKLCNFPRLDLQATGKLEWDNKWYAQQASQKARNAATRQTKGRPANVDLYDGDARGSTCAIGARSSARYLRLYDKTREQGQAVEPNLWRWEIEYKKPLSHAIAKSLIDVEYSPVAIAAQVYAEFAAKGIQPPWEVKEHTEVARIEGRKTSLEKTLDWLRRSVAPTLRKLDSMGYTEEYISALGLQGYEPNDRPE